MSGALLHRPAFARRWWALLALSLLPLLLLALFGPARGLLRADLHMPLFVVALLGMFVSLPLFRRYKLALIACARARGSADETPAWQRLAEAQRNGLLGALLPAWLAALGRLAGLHGVPVLLLVAASLTIAILYRLPRQLD